MYIHIGVLVARSNESLLLEDDSILYAQSPLVAETGHPHSESSGFTSDQQVSDPSPKTDEPISLQVDGPSPIATNSGGQISSGKDLGVILPLKKDVSGTHDIDPELPLSVATLEKLTFKEKSSPSELPLTGDSSSTLVGTDAVVPHFTEISSR